MGDHIEYALQLGFQSCLPLGVQHLHPEERIREFCAANKCGNFGHNYMCPPHIGSLSEIELRLRQYSKGLLLRYGRAMDVRNDRREVRSSKLEFHQMLLKLEEYLKEQGKADVWGMIGGDCALCDACLAQSNQPCLYPEKARTSLESIGIDVLALLKKFGLDNAFHRDKITWTGCVLF